MMSQHDAPSPSRARRWWWAGGAAVVLGVAGLAVTYAVRPNLVRNTATDPRTLLYAAGTLLLVVALFLGVRRLTGRVGPAGAVALVPVALVLALVVVPSFRATTVTEADPLAGLAAATSSSSPAPSAPAPSAPPASTPSAPGEPGTTTPAPEAAAAAPVATSPAAPDAEASTAAPAPEPTEPEAEPAEPEAEPAGPRELGAAGLAGIDHDVTGTASIIDLGDGTSVVRFADFDVEPGPDYFVYLLDGAGVQSPDGGVLLGGLKGTRGDQNYAVPAGTEISGDTTVLIWCRAFVTPVANATITV